MLPKVAPLLLCAGLCAAAYGQAPPPEIAGPKSDEVRQPDAERGLSARIEKLIEQLGDERFELRESATKGLRDIGPVARSALEKASQHPDAEIASRAKGLLATFPKLTHTILDALGAPLPLATVVVSIIKSKPPAGTILLGVEAVKTVTSISDDLGRVAIPEFSEPEFTALAKIHHADYGTARCEVRGMGKVLRVPLVKRGSPAHERALSGQVVTPDGKPVAGAEVHCDHVRTPGEGLLSGIQPLGIVLTETDGRFACYLPNLEGDREQGKLIPANSRYALTIFVPGDDSYFPVTGRYANLAPARIEVPRATRLHRLLVTAVGGGHVEDLEQLRAVRFQYVSEQNGERMFVALDTASVVRGRKLIPGKYQADSFIGGKTLQYLPLVVTADSPEELVLRLPPPATFRGRVVDGTTGQPHAKAFVLGYQAISRNNLALLSADDWRLLRDSSSPAKLDEPAVRRLGNHYGVQGLVRTDDQGRFEITREPDQEFYGLVAFDEHCVPYKIHAGSLKANEQNIVDAGDLPLFPAAKVLVRPVFEGARLSLSPKWLPAEDGQPEWFARFQAAGQGWPREFEYVHWLTLNELQPIYVPAGVRLRLAFETPYDDEWTPAVVDAPLQLKAEATHELGDIRFAAAFPVVVRVIDPAGKPVEGAPVRRKYEAGNAWSVAKNTDKEGRVQFHVNPKSKGEFRVHDLPGGKEARLAANLAAPFEAGDKAPVERYEITLTDEQLRLLRGTGK